MTTTAASPAERDRPSSFRRFARDVLAGRAGIGQTALFTLLAALSEGVGIMLLLPLVNLVAGADLGQATVDRAARAILALLPVRTPTAQLALMLAAFAVLMAIRGAAIVRRDVLIARLQTGFIETLRLRVVDALAAADWPTLGRMRHGRVAHVLSNDIRNCGLAAHLMLQAAVSALLLASQLALALFLSPAIALVVGLLFGAGVLLIRPTLRRSRRLGAELTAAGFRLTDDTTQFLGGLKLAHSQNLQAGFGRAFRTTVAYGGQREVAFARQRAMGQIALTSLAAGVAGIALLLGFGVFRTSAATLVALLVLLGRMSGPAAQIQQGLQHIAHSLPAYDAIRRLEDELAHAAPPARGAPIAAATFDGDIVLAGVGYTHAAAGTRAAGVRDIDLTLQRGAFVGIAGDSGAGKTTLVDLIVGLLAPDHGTVAVGGSPVDERTVHAWRDRISYVSQEPYLFNDSILANLRWARPDATDAAIAEALDRAGATALVERLPAGVDTVVGERGTLLSGGERQRVALARALVRRPRLLVLDEATNAIDVPTERAILAGLAALPDRPTIVMVAHRDQSLAFCDRIVTLRRGRIVPAA